MPKKHKPNKAPVEEEKPEALSPAAAVEEEKTEAPSPAAAVEEEKEETAPLPGGRLGNQFM